MTQTIREQECCYLSTPEHVRSFVGRWIWIYTGKGSLCLRSESLVFTGAKTSLEIPVASINDIGSGHYSRIAKPARLDYMSVTYSREGVDETVLFTPTHSWATPVWKTNALVKDWMASLKQARERTSC